MDVDLNGPVVHRYERGTLAFLSSASLFVAGTFQAAAQRPSFLVRVYLVVQSPYSPRF